ncbi:MAG: SIS domain-containing protein [Chitinophagaceae bacterium]|nr:SIS domain-containing protein [Chitinophagaceae bacterium]
MKDADFLYNNSNGTIEGHLFREIHGQPVLWEETYKAVCEKRDHLSVFLSKIFKISDLQIVLSGAGSSAFIGEILQQPFYNNTRISTTVVPTTDLVTHPKGLFKKSIPTLLISFARSGDSPESVATFDLAERMHDVIYHLIITCNPEGNLAKKAYNKDNAYVFVLPEESNDQALAMTGSFTSMCLAGLLISDIGNNNTNLHSVEKLKNYGDLILKKYASELKQVAALAFKHIIFLGSGGLKGAAKESHLKLLEMTDGRVTCQYDSFLGFRHGPRAGIDDSTLLVYLFSGDPYVYNYEVDLVKSIRQTESFLFSIGVGQCINKAEDMGLNLTINLGVEEEKIPDDYFAVCSVLPAQIMAFYKSLELGLPPDSPSQKGGINRIVQGVSIYPY